MKRITARLLVFALLGALCLLPASAQYRNVRIVPYGFFGYTLSEGIKISETELPNGRFVNEITPVSSISWGLGVDFELGRNWAVGFNFSQQESEFRTEYVGGGSQVWTDMKVRNYHGIFTYNFGPRDARMRPFLFGGIGATQYAPTPIEGVEISGDTKFSSTWGGGIKYYMTPNIGIRISGRWTPTYIYSEAEGIWCSPYWPWVCWVVGSSNYSHQFEFGAALMVRF